MTGREPGGELLSIPSSGVETTPRPARVIALLIVWAVALGLWFAVTDIERHDTGWVRDTFEDECADLFSVRDEDGFVVLDRATACDDGDVLYQREETS